MTTRYMRSAFPRQEHLRLLLQHRLHRQRLLRLRHSNCYRDLALPLLQRLLRTLRHCYGYGNCDSNCDATATATASATPTATATATATATPIVTPTPTATASASGSPTADTQTNPHSETPHDTEAAPDSAAKAGRSEPVIRVAHASRVHVSAASPKTGATRQSDTERERPRLAKAFGVARSPRRTAPARTKMTMPFLLRRNCAALNP